MGVRRALSLCMDLVRSGKKPIYTLGPIIHNNTVTEKLEAFGVRNAKSIDDIEPGSYVLIRSHGITPKVRQELVQRGFNLCDATCPKVARVQAIIKSHVNQGYSIVIIGDHGHAETQGLLGYADDKGVILETMQEADLFIKNTDPNVRVCVVAQTTQEPKVFQQFCRKLESHFKDIKIIDTICDATRKRQEEVSHDASCFDCVIVAGGKNSANTARLYETALKSGKKALHLEGSFEIEDENFEESSSVLITAGASTPFWIMHEIKERVNRHSFFEKLLSVLSSKEFGAVNFMMAFFISLYWFSDKGYGLIAMMFASSLMLVAGLLSMYMGRLDMFDKKLPYAGFGVAGGFLTLGITSLFLEPAVSALVLYYGLLFYVVYKNKAVARRLIIAMLNLSFWILVGGIWYGK